MKPLLFLLALVHFVAGTAPLLEMTANERIENEYIVVFRSNIKNSTRAGHMEFLRNVMRGSSVESKVLHEYTIDGQGAAFRGYAVRTGASTMAAVLEDPEVSFASANQAVQAFQDQETCNRQRSTWNLNRIARPDLPLADQYEWQDRSNGSGVDVYVIDTGIRASHVEFGNRAQFGYDATNSLTSPSLGDDNGHGTHVAGIVGGRTFGVAKGANLIGVKVLTQSGGGTFSDLLDGISWTAIQCLSRGKTCVANLSLGGPSSLVVNLAVDAAVATGVLFVAAAGNEFSDACGSSPAGARSATTVGASTISDQRSSFSNIGNCVDIFAPGSGIASAFHTSDTASVVFSGTSQASPHVAGAAARILSRFPELTPREVGQHLRQSAVANRIINPGQGSPNRLLQAACAV